MKSFEALYVVKVAQLWSRDKSDYGPLCAMFGTFVHLCNDYKNLIKMNNDNDINDNQEDCLSNGVLSLPLIQAINSMPEDITLKSKRSKVIHHTSVRISFMQIFGNEDQLRWQ